MSAVDFLDQWFETDVLKATMSASGIIGTFLGVRSPGTAYVLLHHYMGEIDGAFRSWGLSRGGTGAISDAIAGAAREAGVEIRTETSRLEDHHQGRHCRRRRPRERRLPDVPGRLVERRPEPDVPAHGRRRAPAWRVRVRRQALQVPRLLRQGQPRARCAARLHLPAGSGAASAWRGFDLAEHRLHGARLRRGEVRTLLAPALHRYRDPEPDRSVRRARRANT